MVAIARDREHHLPWIQSFARPTVVPVVLVLAATITGLLLAQKGVVVAVVPLAAVAMLLLVQHPGVVLGVLLGTTILFEADEYGFLPATANYYSAAQPFELLITLLAAAVAFDVIRDKRAVRFPEPFTIPLVFLGLAVLAGAVTGWFADTGLQPIIQGVRPLLYLLLIPWLVVNVVITMRDLLAMTVGAAALAIYKGLEGTAAWFVGAGRSIEDTTLTYYEPTPNFLLLLFCVGVIAALLLRASLPLWIKWAFPLCACAFVLSYRRSFWIAAAVALVLVLLLTAGVQGRRMLLPAIVVVGLGFWLTLGGGGRELNIGGSVAERARTLRVESISANRTDRYRLDEQRNVLRELRSHPITGLGFGIPWRLHYPVSMPDSALQYYTHVVALSYWMRMGLLGLVAYALLMITALVAAFRVWTRFPDLRVRAAGLAILTVLVGLIIAELTASWTGIDYRFSVIFGALLGWLSAASMAATPTDPPLPTAKSHSAPEPV